MKLLENNSFEVLNSSLFMEVGDARIVGRIESYSCKMISTEKQLYKKFAVEAGGSPATLEALSPPQNGYGCYAYSVSPAHSGGYSSRILEVILQELWLRGRVRLRDSL